MDIGLVPVLMSLFWAINCRPRSFTLAKVKMSISQQRNMLESRFKNWHVQENQLYEMGNIVRSTFYGRDAYYGKWMTPFWCVLQLMH